MLDAENWKIALKIYAGHPSGALTLALQLTELKQSLQRGRKGIPEAIEGLDLAIESLYPHTSFHKMGHKLYRQRLEGTIKPRQEKLIRKLGVKT
jgi:hypothetical protein